MKTPKIEEEKINISSIDNERFSILKALYAYSDDFFEVLMTIGESDSLEVKSKLFEKQNGIDVMELRVNHLMAIMYAVFIGYAIKVQDNDLHNRVDDVGNPDILINNSIYLEGKRIPLGFSKYNQDRNIQENTIYTQDDLFFEINRQIQKYKGRKKKANVLSFFIPMYMDEFEDIDELLENLYEKFSRYIDKGSYDFLFDDICFFVNYDNERIEYNIDGKLVFLSLQQNQFKSICYSISKTDKEIELEILLKMYKKPIVLNILKKENDLSVYYTVLLGSKKYSNVLYGYGDLKNCSEYILQKLNNLLLCKEEDVGIYLGESKGFKVYSSSIEDKDGLGCLKYRVENI